MVEDNLDKRIVSEPVASIFFKSVIPSIVGLLALSSIGIVDGIFIGNFVSSDALAAINLMLPYFSFNFALALMLGVGGSVRAGKYIGEGRHTEASEIFTKTLLVVVLLIFVIVVLSLVLERWLFMFLAAPETLYGLMRPYFRIVSISLLVQLPSIVLYCFIRADGKLIIGSIALVVSAVANVGLNTLFVGYWGWGLAGAAWATAIIQIIQLAILLSYFLRRDRGLHIKLAKRGWREFWQAVFNGISEFINEVSSGLVIFVLNWLLIIRVGVDGVAAFGVISYIIVVGLMILYGIVNAMYPLLSQNYGAKNQDRINKLCAVALCTVIVMGMVMVVALQVGSKALIGFFLDSEAATNTAKLAVDYIKVIWPMFLVNGVNLLISAYLTAMQQPLASATVALLRSLILPVGLMLYFFNYMPHWPFLLALPIAEWVTFFIAIFIFIKFSPKKVLNMYYLSIPQQEA